MFQRQIWAVQMPFPRNPSNFPRQVWAVQMTSPETRTGFRARFGLYRYADDLPETRAEFPAGVLAVQMIPQEIQARIQTTSLGIRLTGRAMGEL